MSTRRLIRRFAAMIAAMSFTACGGNEGPTLASLVWPDVAGSYRGTMTFSYDGASDLLAPCPATTTVTQAANAVTFGPFVLSGDCGDVSFPLGQSTISLTGGFPLMFTLFTDSCNNYESVTTAGFTGPELRISVNATSPTCPTLTLIAVLLRQ